MQPGPHTDCLLISFPPGDDIEISDGDPDQSNSAPEKNYVPDGNGFEPHTFSQAELNDIVRDLSFSKDKAELLASRLNEENLVKRDVCITYFRQKNVVLHFS